MDTKEWHSILRNVVAQWIVATATMFVISQSSLLSSKKPVCWIPVVAFPFLVFCDSSAVLLDSPLSFVAMGFCHSSDRALVRTKQDHGSEKFVNAPVLYFHSWMGIWTRMARIIYGSHMFHPHYWVRMTYDRMTILVVLRMNIWLAKGERSHTTDDWRVCTRSYKQFTPRTLEYYRTSVSTTTVQFYVS